MKLIIQMHCYDEEATVPRTLSDLLGASRALFRDLRQQVRPPTLDHGGRPGPRGTRDG